jgi:DNA-directed RNA polymerase specialized sigma24 family protein
MDRAMNNSNRIYLAVQQNMDGLYTFARRMMASQNEAEKLLKQIIKKIRSNQMTLVDYPDIRACLYKLLYQHARGTQIPENRITDEKIPDISLYEHLNYAQNEMDNIVSSIASAELKMLIDQLPGRLKPYLLLNNIACLSYEQIAFITEEPLHLVSERIFQANKVLQFKIWQNLKNRVESTV